MKTKIGFATLWGFAVGVLASSAYLLLGGEYLIFVPRWASIVFYPGFSAGYWVAEHWRVADDTAKVIGVLAVGLAYALIAALTSLIWNMVRRTAATQK